MYAPQLVLVFWFCSILTPNCSASVQNTVNHDIETKKVKLFDGVSVKIPRGNDTAKLLSFEILTDNGVVEGRKKQKKLLENLLPLFIMPFVLQSAIVPLFLGMLKFMLFKSLMVGKLALLLIVLNAFKNHNSFKGRDAEMAHLHYGYNGNGMEEYGAYVN
ncbi:uncharacterized protein LOC115450909 [Manduca sexta]|uniref:Uncharacterized protein n=1 Tax=Manduca sexta TaxID=7130 RepID=A0A921ZPH7_MANSE|nr:uncharacterized protein LOC115450909 [Manduca sexta]KAG6461414.1 hypothetical protein O3G_MSEX012611 [Manduca sexta]